MLKYSYPTNERQQMKLTHQVNVDVEFNDKTTPDYVLLALTTMKETELQKMLADVFINSLSEIDALTQINENNSYATVSFPAVQN
jgi:hypothetical protein